jgi:hypothetical protein
MLNMGKMGGFTSMTPKFKSKAFSKTRGLITLLNDEILHPPAPSAFFCEMKDRLFRALVAASQFIKGWRVPVVLLRGPDRAAGREVTLLVAGQRHWTHYFIHRFFAHEPAVVRTRKVVVWRLRALLDAWQHEAEMTLVAIDRVSSRLFLKPAWLGIPVWVGSSMLVPADWKSLSSRESRIAGDLRRVRNTGFECEVSRSTEDFELFYEKFYLPTVRTRHGENPFVISKGVLRAVFRQGMILWCKRDGEKLAADLVLLREPGKMAVISNGIIDGNEAWLRKGVLSSLYVFSVELAWELGCTRIFMGGSRPSLHDGVFRYKKKWSDALYRHGGLVSGQYEIRLRWKHLPGPVADFLSHTSLIHHDQDGFSALWFFPRDLPLTAESLARQHKDLTAAGLRRFRILLPGPPPPGFVCPPHVQLIPLADAARLQAHELGEWEPGGVIGAEAA